MAAAAARLLVGALVLGFAAMAAAAPERLHVQADGYDLYCVGYVCAQGLPR
jgi:hypothetical protein